MEDFNLVSLIYLGIIIVLIGLTAVSFTYFIRRILVNSSEKNNQLSEMGKKLDQIIDLLEKDSDSR
ncbi:DUF4083 domain-containing protein [Radiobacillus deserti]|uniref:DUF4083 domain-containing protein n=1 Tax=Radiobacillus deserti TaxID=2594883 RepID=A0A516KJ39_9BACI|nr:DUF4083 domain-containing protein [Radiobacillus deserti]QDP41413.1 DUF4083 domain-containing protein [Radiobacillus deserti]